MYEMLLASGASVNARCDGCRCTRFTLACLSASLSGPHTSFPSTGCITEVVTRQFALTLAEAIVRRGRWIGLKERSIIFARREWEERRRPRKNVDAADCDVG
jgi:hypothetical protein